MNPFYGIILIILATLNLIGALYLISQIGKPRVPITAKTVAFQVLITGFVVVIETAAGVVLLRG